MKRHTLNKIDRMAVLAFRNAIRLHYDSIRLYRARSYPSALALSILAIEEIGKYFVLEDFVWHSRVDGPYTPEEEQKILRDTYDHRVKQRWFANQVDLPGSAERTLRAAASGALDRTKLQSLYVGLPRRGGRVIMKERIVSPFRISRRRAEKPITEVNDFLLWLAVGVVNGDLLLDAYGIERVLTRRLVRTLTERWQHSARRRK